MASPLVSVVIPVFNGLPYVHHALASVLNQTYPSLEVWLTDGGSTDGSREWVRTLSDPRVHTSELPAGTGAAANWTYATQQATGTYVKLLCQDDLLHPDAIAWQVQALEERSECVAVIGTRDIVSASGKVLYRGRGLSGVPDGRVSGQAVLRACHLAGTNVIGEPHTVLFRREPLECAMPWDDTRPFLLDLDTYTSIFARPDAQVVAAHRSIGAFRVSTSSWSTRLLREQREQMSQWQAEYEAAHHVSPRDRLIARVASRTQVGLRRAAYTWLRLKGDLS